MSEPIRISFVDFWFDFDHESNFIVDSLESIGSVKIVRRNPDLLFYSVFGTKNLGYLGKKVLINPEIHSVGYGRPDFSISYHEATNPGRLRLPIWAWHSQPELLVPSSQRFPMVGQYFCNFTYSNPNCEFRNRFFLALDRIKSVDSLGAAFRSESPRFTLDSRDSINWRGSKALMLSNYRFTISFENVSAPGYSTEKLSDAFLAGSVPIYWGDPFIAEDFNEQAFISAHSFNSYKDLIDRVFEVEEDAQELAKLRAVPPMTKQQYVRYFDHQLKNFLQRCIASEKQTLRRRLVRATWGHTARWTQPAIRHPLSRYARSLSGNP